MVIVGIILCTEFSMIVHTALQVVNWVGGTKSEYLGFHVKILHFSGKDKGYHGESDTSVGHCTLDVERKEYFWYGNVLRSNWI